MTWWTDDRRLHWEQRRLDEQQAAALKRIEAEKKTAKEKS